MPAAPPDIIIKLLINKRKPSNGNFLQEIACNLISVIVNYNTRGAHQYIGTDPKAGPEAKQSKERNMFTMVAENTRKTFSAVAAVAIVSFGGLVMDQAYLAAAPKGRVEVGELTALDGATQLAQLPEVTVVARREAGTRFAAAQLPEIVVVAKRVATLVARDELVALRPAPSISAGF
jgi:hypothetical protein